MTSDEFIERVLEIGYEVHLNDGVYWIEYEPFFYSPVIPYQVIEPGKAKPKMLKALLGYRHHVSDKKYANTYEPIQLMSEARLINFGMQSLSSSTRARVRKGLRLTKVIRIEEIEPVLDDMKAIEISKARRFRQAKPPEYYMKYDNKWRDWTIKQFNGDRGKKEYWGSFYNDTLIAYMKIQQMYDMMMINNVASHSSHLDKCPNDALLFSVLEYCRNLPSCKKVSHGGWDNDNPTLNKFKQKYGFERVDLPVYAKYYFHILPILKKILELIKFKELSMSYYDRLRHTSTD